MLIEPTKRFSDRVENYVRYRPGYPDEVVTFLKDQCQLLPGSVIADIGSGTGIFSALLLNQRYKVFAVEPNEDMQQAAIVQLGGDENFVPVNGSAENTTLKDKSVDLIVCAQAFHWFNNEKTKAEFKRILKDDGDAALIWNNRLADADEFSIAYEDILKKETTEYSEVNHRNISDADLKTLFRNGEYKTVYYPNEQLFDEDGLMGRAFSSSYVPAETTGEGKRFRQLLKEVFEKYKKDGRVKFSYQTEVYLGKV